MHVMGVGQVNSSFRNIKDFPNHPST